MDLSDQIRDFLGDITLADLVKRQEIRDIPRDQKSRASTQKRATTSSIPLSND